MSSSNSPISTGSYSPIFPKTLPSAEGYVNPPRAENPRLQSIIEHVRADHMQRPRASSANNISFRSASKTSQTYPAGTIRPKPPSLLRGASPPPARFQHHVSFDNFAGGEPTKKNTISFTLNASHNGYQRRRRSRTFMVGVDENDYSDTALQWMLEEMVDDGDHIICLRVVDKDSKIASDRNMERREYQKAATDLMQRIQTKNDENRAIIITLEFAIGKVSTTFEKMIGMYEPSMLVVGTRGRSLGGFQGLVSNRNSFSKWCLQHSPIPVVVVRPTEKRIKKKLKRDADPTRQDYARILKESGVEEHEITGGANGSSFEVSNDLDAEASAVADALGLPSRFDPTRRTVNLDGNREFQRRDSVKSDTVTTLSEILPESRSNSPSEVVKEPKSAQLDSPAVSVDEAEDSEDEDEDEEEEAFEAVPGHVLLGQQPEDDKREKLHRMEQGEADALLLGRKNSISSGGISGSRGIEAPIDGDEEDEEEREQRERVDNKDEGEVKTHAPK